MKRNTKKGSSDEENDTQKSETVSDFDVPYPDVEQDANMDIEISTERHLIFSTKINSPTDISKFQSSVCDLLKITNPPCSVFGTSTYMLLRMNIMRKLLRQASGATEEEDGDKLSIYPAQGTVITFSPDNELGFFKIYPVLPTPTSATPLVGTKRQR